MIHPASDCLVRNCNSALGEQILDVTKAEREPEIEPDRLVDDLRWEPIAGVADFPHALRLPSRRRRDNAITKYAGDNRGDPPPNTMREFSGRFGYSVRHDIENGQLQVGLIRINAICLMEMHVITA
jgi:hypothetical protein